MTFAAQCRMACADGFFEYNGKCFNADSVSEYGPVDRGNQGWNIANVRGVAAIIAGSEVVFQGMSMDEFGDLLNNS